MNKIGDVENKEVTNNSKTDEAHFDEKGYNELMNEIEKERAEQKGIG